MKLTVAFCCLVLYTVNALPTDDNTPSTHTYGHKSGHTSLHKTANDLAPPERRFGSGDSPSAIQCVGTCAQEMKEKQARDQRTSSAGQTEQEKVIKKCSIHDAAKTCLNRCQNSQTKSKMTNQMSADQFMCHDSTYRQNANCINEAHQAGAAARESKCGQYERKLDHYLQNEPTTLAGLKDMILQNCLFMKCIVDNDKAKIIEKCGQPAFNDWKGIFAKTAETMKNSMERLGLDVYPRECDRVATA